MQGISSHQLVLGQVAVEQKSNEIKAIPILIFRTVLIISNCLLCLLKQEKLFQHFCSEHLENLNFCSLQNYIMSTASTTVFLKAIANSHELV